MIDFKMVEQRVEGIRLCNAVVGHVEPPSVHICRIGMKPFDRFFYVRHGCIHFACADGRHLSAGPGDIVYLPCDVTYESKWDPAEKGECISLNFRMYESGQLCSAGDSIEIVTSDRAKTYYALFRRACELWVSGDYGGFFSCNAVFWEILQKLYADYATQNLRDTYDRIYKSILFIRNNYQTDVTSEALARLCEMSMTSFRREFKERLGMSPTKYKNRLRLEKARFLIECGECSVGEAGRLVGFTDLYYFSKLFKREFGINASACIPK